MKQGTAVYRLYDAAGALLYVGVANRPEERWGTHRNKHWWPLVTRAEIERHPTRDAALRCEAQVIRDETPLHNQVIPNTDGSPHGARLRDDAPCLAIRRGPRPKRPPAE
jgi:predicted GIY-YIG superfamily endonuclease